jgi:hypothetical protein
MLELLLGSGQGCWVRLGERVGRCGTLMFLSSRSALAGQDGRLCWHRGQIRRRHHGWRGRCHRWRFRHHGAWLPTAAAGFGAGRLPERLELVGGLAAQLVKLGYGLLGEAFDLRPLPQPPGRLGELLIPRSAGLGPQHISGGTAGDQAEPAWHPG